MEGITQGIFVLGKGGRVEDDEVVLIAHAVKILEGIFGVCRMARVAREVKFYILVCQVDGFGRAIYRVHELGSTTHGIERESARVAKHVEYGAVFGVTLEQRTIFALVNEETGLLSLEPIDMEVQAVFHRYIVGTSTQDEAIFLTEVGLEGERGF